MLPFTNLSGEAGQEYFTDGITDDLITDLAKISGLHVASRHSIFAIKSENLSIHEACSRLGVRYALEGSVRKLGDRLRITVQLVDSESAGHLWAERYDRVLHDVFAVQDEIGRNIVDALKVKLLPSEEVSLRRAPTDSIEAYRLYLRGQQLCRQRSKYAYETARLLFAYATQLDCNFARAHAGVAECEANNYLHHESKRPITQTLATAERAIELEPSLAAAHVARANALIALRRYADAEVALKRAIVCEPEHFRAHYTYARLCFEEGRKAEAERWLHCAMRLDPEDIHAPVILIGLEHTSGRFDDERSTARLLLTRAERGLENYPESARAAYAMGAALATLGDAQAARHYSERALALAPNDHPVYYNVACTYVYLGDHEVALDILENTMPGAAPHRWAWLSQDADFDPLRQNTRFMALLEQHCPP